MSYFLLSKRIFNLFKVLFTLFVFLLLMSLTWRESYASWNKFGIHILEPSDLERASLLVNSSGGDWGWVTIVIRDDDLDFSKWQSFMDQCREKHLIPLVRIATHPEGENWVKPLISDVKKWVSFLQSLNWPTKDRYVIIFNEPNHTKEWGGEINPSEYALILNSFIESLKNANSNFKILNSGFDIAASNSKTTMDAFLFWQKMDEVVPGIFNKIDAWASHSYPSSNERLVGVNRFSVRGYEWELAFLKKSLELERDLPVFITETGFKGDISGENIKDAFENEWLKDKRVVAVTPFILNYPYPPFSEFSWLDKSGVPYPQYELIRSIPKQSWWPEQEEKYILGKPLLPPFMFTESIFKGKIFIKNIGQSILGERQKLILYPKETTSNIELKPAVLSSLLKPGEQSFLDFEIKTSTTSGKVKVGWEGTEDTDLNIFSPSLIRKLEFSIWEKILFGLNYRLHSIFNIFK